MADERKSASTASASSSSSSVSILSAQAHGSKIIHRINDAIKNKRAFYSFEYFPPKTAEGVANLYSRIDRMAMLQPMFMDVTWGAGGTTAELTLEISENAQNYCSAEVMMHLTCTNMDESMVASALARAKASGIRNILALRGDPPKGQDQWEATDSGFSHAVDLVRYIRKEYGDYFGIAVAGYPETHTAAKSFDDDIRYLKEKVDAGADFVITQLFYDVELYVEYVARCREIGISCPIIPGIMPIQNYNGFKRMTSFCKTFVPARILDELEPIKGDDARVKQFGIQLAIDMCKELLDKGAPGLHFYTLNLEKSVIHILAGLGFITLDHKKDENALPWKKSQLATRKKEDVRPIFWANRPRSYLSRTTTWDEFPNGRWGDARSPAFGDLSDYHLCSFKTGSVQDRRMIWGAELHTEKDVYEVFAQYIAGKVPRLPWCENTVQLETVPLKDVLLRMNRAGILTINSQPRVNGVRSDDPAVGWGGPDGYVFQKAYLEFFCPPPLFRRFRSLLSDFPSLTYHAVNVSGQSYTNVNTEKGVNAVTWGVFPAKEIIQPTVVDPHSFMVWKDEAFALWQSQWQTIYPGNSASSRVLEQIRSTYFLVNVVDNDFIQGDIFEVFERVLEQGGVDTPSPVTSPTAAATSSS